MILPTRYKPRLAIIDGYWVDPVSECRWLCSSWTRAQAIRAARGMIDCVQCVDSSGCMGCVRCVGCVDCSYCVQCEMCKGMYYIAFAVRNCLGVDALGLPEEMWRRS